MVSSRINRLPEYVTIARATHPAKLEREKKELAEALGQEDDTDE